MHFSDANRLFFSLSCTPEGSCLSTGLQLRRPFAVLGGPSELSLAKGNGHIISNFAITKIELSRYKASAFKLHGESDSAARQTRTDDPLVNSQLSFKAQYCARNLLYHAELERRIILCSNLL